MFFFLNALPYKDALLYSKPIAKFFDLLMKEGVVKPFTSVTAEEKTSAVILAKHHWKKQQSAEIKRNLMTVRGVSQLLVARLEFTHLHLIHMHECSREDLVDLEPAYTNTRFLMKRKTSRGAHHQYASTKKCETVVGRVFYLS
ncbi:6284_t:CDS:2 [Funneliformis mosseae]|uniref:6284_t:CDS:1 n=1 Tax=Funneliformis mosseae TaxID=27381 RepID=A0A9N8VRQ9_FUNMO|nr:6284_t:CDS:2 [Funneliformis mosseae]